MWSCLNSHWINKLRDDLSQYYRSLPSSDTRQVTPVSENVWRRQLPVWCHEPSECQGWEKWRRQCYLWMPLQRTSTASDAQRADLMYCGLLVRELMVRTVMSGSLLQAVVSPKAVAERYENKHQISWGCHGETFAAHFWNSTVALWEKEVLDIKKRKEKENTISHNDIYFCVKSRYFFWHSCQSYGLFMPVVPKLSLLGPPLVHRRFPCAPPPNNCSCFYAP